MSFTVAQLADTLQTVLTSTAEQAAREAHFIRRRRCLSGASFVQTLVFGWLHNPDATLEELACLAATLHTPISAQALDRRFTPAATDCVRLVLTQAVHHLVAAQPLALPLLQRFRGVYLLDSTHIALPAALAERFPGARTVAGNHAGLKVQVRWDVLHGTLDGVAVEAGRALDVGSPLNRAPLPAGSLRLADLGYFDVGVLQAYDQEGVYWLTRLKYKVAVRVEGQPIPNLAAWLQQQGSGPIERRVQVGNPQRLDCRLLAVRVPAAVGQLRRQRVLKEARDKGYRVSQGRLALCDWTVFISNVPAGLLSAAEAEVLARVRWQVELLFKRWKSQGRIDASRSGKPERILCEIYAKLLAMVVQHWVVLLGWGAADRSLSKAARPVRERALLLAWALAVRRELISLLKRLRVILRRLRVNKRRRKPALFQLLANHPKKQPQAA